MKGGHSSSDTEQYGWRFRDGWTQTDVIVVGDGRPQFWDQYGEQVTVVSWSIDTGGEHDAE